MTGDTQEKPFKLQGIELISFLIQPQAGKNLTNAAVEFNIKQEQKTNHAKQLVFIFTSVSIIQSGNNNVLASIKTGCGFTLQDFDNLIRKEEKGGYLIPHELNIALNRISLSTSRGILFSELRGYYLQDMILPLLPIE